MSLHYGPPLNRSPRLHGSATRQPTFLSSGTSLQHSAVHSLLTRYGTATAFANPVLAQVGGPLSRLPAQRRGKEAKCLIHGKDTHTSRERLPAPRGAYRSAWIEDTARTAGHPAHSVGVPLTHTNPAQRTLHVMRDSSRCRKEAGIATRQRRRSLHLSDAEKTRG